MSERDLDGWKIRVLKGGALVVYLLWIRDLIVEKRIGPRIRCYWKVN